MTIELAAVVKSGFLGVRIAESAATASVAVTAYEPRQASLDRCRVRLADLGDRAVEPMFIAGHHGRKTRTGFDDVTHGAVA